ncbi:MAG TPA: acetate kinase [Longimicrobiales bacterium]|nr:acetate kinase [Longimicrobiales bacterium]
MNVLVLNAGSSTLKFQMIRTDADRIAADQDERLADGVIERIGGESVIATRVGDGVRKRATARLKDMRAAVDWVCKWLVATDGTSVRTLSDIDAVGHRVVHGGERFRRSVRIDANVLAEIEDMIDLAPLHNPANIKAIEAVSEILGDVPQTGVFDTAFHHTLPDKAYLYALPYWVYRRYKIRRYGFHGTSHRYVAHRYRQLADKTKAETNVITLHLGNGASACAISGGRSVDTSMGFTPLEGLIMGTRAGDMDPAILDFLAAKEGLSDSAMQTMLNKQSGLQGISGITNDMRELLAEAEENDDRRAWLAIEMFAYRIRKYIGAYLAAMGGADAVIFTGGIGENAAEIRNLVLQDMEWAGIHLDPAANVALQRGDSGRITRPDSPLEAWVIPTNEELLIARDTVRLVSGLPVPF